MGALPSRAECVKMATLGKKRNRPTLEARMRGLATQARKVELAEPAIRAHRQMQAEMMASRHASTMPVHNIEVSVGNTQQMGATVNSRKMGSTTGPGLQQQQQRGQPETARSNLSRFSADERAARHEIVDQRKLDNDGGWDMIVQYNQREGRRIAAMAAVE